jgi:ABC-type lipoprotein release transport system permease subunit
MRSGLPHLRTDRSLPVTLAAVAITLALVAVIASLGQAYRAARLDPLQVLRAD